MKIKTMYNSSIKNLNLLDEVIFPPDQEIKDLPSFAQKYPDIKIWYQINVTTLQELFALDLDTLKEIGAGIELLYFTKELAEGAIKLGFRVSYGPFITTFEELHYAIRNGVSSIYITTPLTFNMPAVKAVLDVYDGDVCVMPDIVQSAVQDDIEYLRKGFYILPNDLQEYENYGVNTLFIGQQSTRTGTIVKIYKSGKWDLQAGPLISGFPDFSVFAHAIPFNFASRRASCKQRCLSHNAPCNICNMVINFKDQDKKDIEKS